MSFEIEQIAELARLSLQPEERSRLKHDLEAILNYVEQLKTLPTDPIEPTSHVLNLENVFRKDEAKLSDVRDKVLKSAPRREGNFFKVPKIIE